MTIQQKKVVSFALGFYQKEFDRSTCLKQLIINHAVDAVFINLWASLFVFSSSLRLRYWESLPKCSSCKWTIWEKFAVWPRCCWGFFQFCSLHLSFSPKRKVLQSSALKGSPNILFGMENTTDILLLPRL